MVSASAVIQSRIHGNNHRAAAIVSYDVSAKCKAASAND
jgi:hypothetical protein